MNSRSNSAAIRGNAELLFDAPGNTARADRPKTMPLIRGFQRKANSAKGAREACGMTQVQLAAHFASHFPAFVQARITEWENPSLRHAPNVEHLEAAPPAFRKFYVDRLASLDAEPLDIHGDNDHARIAAVTKEVGDVIVGGAVAMADGVFCQQDAARMLPEIREAQQALAEKLARCERLIGGGR